MEPTTSAESSSHERAMERRDRLRLLMDRLEAALAAPAGREPEAWRHRVALVGADVAEAFGDHVHDTECKDGLFDEVMAENPRLAHRIDQLKDDHVDLTQVITRLNATLSDPSEPETIREQGVALLAALIHHRHSGAEMLHEAYWVETSSG